MMDSFGKRDHSKAGPKVKHSEQRESGNQLYKISYIIQLYWHVCRPNPIEIIFTNLTRVTVFGELARSTSAESHAYPRARAGSTLCGAA